MILACDSAVSVQSKENLHFAPRQASSSQNSNVDSYLQYCGVDSLRTSKSDSSLTSMFDAKPKFSA